MTAKATKARLQNAGLELTDHRQTVLLAVANAENPSSAPEIFEQLQQGINRVTVYRILDLLVEKGVLNRLGLGEKSSASVCVEPNRVKNTPTFIAQSATNICVWKRRA